jgi:hypothetical protein
VTRRFAAALAALLLLMGALAGPGGAVESFELAGTVRQAGCGGASKPCSKLPKGERIGVAIDAASRIASVPVDAGGHYSIVLPAGTYQATPGLLREGPVAIERFSPESVPVVLHSDLTSVDFTYELAEAVEPIAVLRFGGSVGDVPLTTFSISSGRSGRTSKSVLAETQETGTFRKLEGAVAHGRIFPRIRLEVFKHHTRTRTYLLTLKTVAVDGVQVAAGGAALRFSLQAKETAVES